MKQFNFYKEIDGKWFVDLPDWPGTKDQLEMMLGADYLLEYLSEGKNKVSITVSLSEFSGSNLIEFKSLATDLENGAYYFMKLYNGIELNLNLWLCNVLLFIFNEFPSKIYFSNIEI